MKWSIRCLTGVALLISALWAKGCYETPYDGGPQYGSGGGDQYRRPTSTTASIARIRRAFQCAQ